MAVSGGAKTDQVECKLDRGYPTRSRADLSFIVLGIFQTIGRVERTRYVLPNTLQRPFSDQFLSNQVNYSAPLRACLPSTTSEMPSGNKIGFGIISPETNQVGTFSIPSQYAASFPGEASPVHSLVPELGDEEQDRPSSELSVEHHASSDQGVESGDLQQSHSSKHSDKATPSFPTRLPRLSRSMSLPASSHLNQLKRPDRRDNVAALSSYQQEVSNELADTVQAVVQTLLHISPPHLLDPVKERFSTCTIQMPTPSVFSLITTMKNLNYISANLPSFGPLSEIEEVLAPSNGRASDTFDIGEVVQSVADVLGGLAAQTRVDLVLFHGDVGMKHINVVGDECCILFVLTHVSTTICPRRPLVTEVNLFPVV